LREVVITGLGPVAPNGVGKEQFWDALKKGESGIRYIEHFAEQYHHHEFAGVVPRHWLSGEQGGSWRNLMIVTASHLAMADAGISKDEFSRRRSGIRIGIGAVDMEIGEREYDKFKQSGTTASSVIAATIPHAAAAEIAKDLQCKGKVLTYASACTSGIISIISAADSILDGEADMVLAGGGDAPLTPFTVTCFEKAGLHPVNNMGLGDNPSTASRPFDAKREGGVIGEGAGMILLEDRESASRRGAKIYARIAGWGIANATSLKTLKAAYVAAMTEALNKARLSPNEIDYISAHAPGIMFTDRIEVSAIKEVFGRYSNNVPTGSIKSMIGNPLAASGPLQVIAAAQSIEHKFIPPTTNYENLDPQCDLDCIPNQGRVARVSRVLINASGVGGCVASLIISDLELAGVLPWTS